MTPNSSRQFSLRERQIVDALLEAKAVKDIARDLDLSVNTVKDYLKTIYRKAQVHSARELMLKVARPAAVLADTALAQLLQTAQTLQPTALPSEAMQHLASAIRRCTRAQKVNFWRLVRGPGEMHLVGENGGGTLRVDPFVHRVLERGWARLDAAELNGPEGRQLAAAGLRGEILGVQCSPTPRVHMLLASDPTEGAFGPLDLATARLLVRLAQSAGDHRLAALAASA